MALRLRGEVTLPAHAVDGGFDHGDVHLPTGRVFVAHTANDTVEVIDGPQLRHLATIAGCKEASGVLASPDGAFVVAAARGVGQVLVIDPLTNASLHKVEVGGRPNGLAWDSKRGRFLVADVAGSVIAIVEPAFGRVIASGPLPGRSAWAAYEPESDQYLVNIRSSTEVVAIDPESGRIRNTWHVSSAGPHGMDLDHNARRAFIACESGRLICLDSDSGQELGSVAIAGVPDVIWFNPVADEIYVAIGDPGVVQVVDARELSVTETTSTGQGAHTLAFDRQRQELFVFRPSTCSMLAYTVSRT